MMLQLDTRVFPEYQNLLEKKGDIDIIQTKSIILSVCIDLLINLACNDQAVQDLMKTSKRKAVLPAEATSKSKKPKAAAVVAVTFGDECCSICSKKQKTRERERIRCVECDKVVHFKCALLMSKPAPGEYTCSDHNGESSAGTMSVPSHSRLTVNALHRKTVVLELVRESKVIEFGHTFVGVFQERFNLIVGNNAAGMLS